MWERKQMRSTRFEEGKTHKILMNVSSPFAFLFNLWGSIRFKRPTGGKQGGKKQRQNQEKIKGERFFFERSMRKKSSEEEKTNTSDDGEKDDDGHLQEAAISRARRRQMGKADVDAVMRAERSRHLREL